MEIADAYRFNVSITFARYNAIFTSNANSLFRQVDYKLKLTKEQLCAEVKVIHSYITAFLSRTPAHIRVRVFTYRSLSVFVRLANRSSFSSVEL